MNVILLVAATLLAVVSSEPIGDRRTRDVKHIINDESSDERNSSLNENESEDYEQNNGLDAVPGVPGKDYPNFNFIPKTSFTCSDKKPGGYYADIETRCQVFHVCNVGDVKSSFLCPPGSIFNQKYLVCDWWYDFECEHASDLFSYKDTVNRERIESNFNEGANEFYTSNENSHLDTRQFAHQENNNSVNDATDLSLAGTGEGGLGYSRNKSNRQFENSEPVNSQKNQQIDRNLNSMEQFPKISTYRVNNRNDDFHQQSRYSNEQSQNYLNVRNNQNVNNQNNRRIQKNENYNQNYNYEYQPSENENYNRNYQNENENRRDHQNENYHRNHQSRNENRNYQNLNENIKTNRHNNETRNNPNLDQNRNKLSDSVPRGFAVNYGKSSNSKNQIPPNNQRDNYSESKNIFTTPSVINYLRKDESNFQQEISNIPYQSTENLPHQESEIQDDETIFNIDEEDAFERQRQSEVDNTILNKKFNNNFAINDEFNYDYDSESRILSSERPPSTQNDNYYNNYYEDKSNSHFSSERENFTNQNKYRAENANGPNSQQTINDRKLDNNLRPPHFSTGNTNPKGIANKESAHNSGIIPNSEDNGFFSLGTQSSTGSRSFSQINEFTTVNDNSRLTNEKSDFRQSPSNDNQQNAYDFNAQSNYRTFSNYENSNQSQKEY